MTNDEYAAWDIKNLYDGTLRLLISDKDLAVHDHAIAHMQER